MGNGHRGVAHRIFHVRRMVQCIRHALGWLEIQHATLRRRARDRLFQAHIQTHTPRLRFESLEPRVLLSADLTGSAAAGQLVGTLLPNDTPRHRRHHQQRR
jgi:hypothetical protein